MFDSGWAAALAAIVTALIVAGTAVAAFRQLRHGRNANDIVVYLRLIDFMDSPATVAVRVKLAEYADTFVDVCVRAKQHTDSGAWAREYAALERDTRELPNWE
jgi:hypothetical protein